MWNWIGKLEELQKRGEVFVVATMVSVSGSVPREVGAKMIVLADGTIFGTIGGGGIEKLVINDAKNIVLDGESRVKKYSLKAEAGMSCGGAAEVLYEVINKGPKLYVFGAGHVAQALCRTLIGSPFRVELIDWREEWVMSTKIPDGVIRHKKSWQDFIAQAPWSVNDTYVVIMTYAHSEDEVVLEEVLKHETKYVGLMGSKTKWKELGGNIAKRGMSEKKLNDVFCPIGLKLGGKSPTEISISIAAEILQVYYGK